MAGRKCQALIRESHQRSQIATEIRNTNQRTRTANTPKRQTPASRAPTAQRAKSRPQRAEWVALTARYNERPGGGKMPRAHAACRTVDNFQVCQPRPTGRAGAGTFPGGSRRERAAKSRPPAGGPQAPLARQASRFPGAPSGGGGDGRGAGESAARQGEQRCGVAAREP